MAENSLVAEARDGTGKGAARKLRAAGRMPAVVYGRERAAQSVVVSPDALQKVLRGKAGLNTLIDLTLDGSTSTVLVKSLQREPVRGRYLHADFYQVDLTQQVTVAVPVHLIGKAAGDGLRRHPRSPVARAVDRVPSARDSAEHRGRRHRAQRERLDSRERSAAAPGLTSQDRRLARRRFGRASGGRSEAAPAAAVVEGEVPRRARKRLRLARYRRKPRPATRSGRAEGPRRAQRRRGSRGGAAS